MILEVFALIVEIVFINILFSLVLFTIFLTLFKLSLDKVFIFYLLIFLGLGPAISVFILNILLLFLPHLPSFFYFGFLLFTCLSLLLAFKKKIYEVLLFIFSQIEKNLKSSHVIFFGFMTILYCLIWIFYVAEVPILGHDMFEYGTQGKIFYQQKQIAYSQNYYNSNSGFYYVGTHGFSFPLFSTLQNILNNIFHFNKDYYFRSITGYYWGLIAFTYFYLLYKKNFLLATTGVMVLLTTAGFTGMFGYYHIDTYRIFLLMGAFIFLMFALKAQKAPDIVMFGVFSGVASNAHSLNLIFVCIFILTYFIFARIPMRVRLKYATLVVLLTLIFGAYHYLLDIFIGTGWLLKDIIIF